MGYTSVITERCLFRKLFTTRSLKLKSKYISGAGEVFLYLVQYRSLQVFFSLNWYIYFPILSPLSEFILLIQIIIYKFLWKGPDKIARRAAINSSDYGGLNITDLETSIKSLRLAWISKIFNPEPSPRKSYVRHLLKRYRGFFYFTATIILMIIILIRLLIQKCCSGGLNFAQIFQRILKLMTL